MSVRCSNGVEPRVLFIERISRPCWPSTVGGHRRAAAMALGFELRGRRVRAVEDRGGHRREAGLEFDRTNAERLIARAPAHRQRHRRVGGAEVDRREAAGAWAGMGSKCEGRGF